MLPETCEDRNNQIIVPIYNWKPDISFWLGRNCEGDHFCIRTKDSLVFVFASSLDALAFKLKFQI
jgi:hypothetical protein